MWRLYDPRDVAWNTTGESAMSIDQMNFYQSKLAYEMDSADLYEAVGRDEPIVVVDGRSADAYALEHIPDSISLPHREISFNSTESLDKSKLYVCYCDGIGCNASTKTALKSKSTKVPGMPSGRAALTLFGMRRYQCVSWFECSSNNWHRTMTWRRKIRFASRPEFVTSYRAATVALNL